MELLGVKLHFRPQWCTVVPNDGPIEHCQQVVTLNYNGHAFLVAREKRCHLPYDLETLNRGKIRLCTLNLRGNRGPLP